MRDASQHIWEALAAAKHACAAHTKQAGGGWFQ